MKKEKFKWDRAALEGVENLKNDRESGASEIALKAIKTFFNFLKKNRPEKEQIQALAETIAETRPSMAPLKNVIAFSARLALSKKENQSIDSIEREALAAFEKARRETVEIAAEALGASDAKTFVVCSFSSTAALTLKELSRRRSIRVVCLESSVGGKKYGLAFLERLRRFGTEASLAKDAEIRIAAKNSDAALIGADSILPDGSAINGRPSASLAKAAREFGVPFFVVAESFKKTDAASIEEGFELVAANLITRIYGDGVFSRLY